MRTCTAIVGRAPFSSPAGDLTKKTTTLTLSRRTGRTCGVCWATRYDSQRALQAINDLYANELHRFRNLFLPSVKLVRKVRVGSRTRRIYGKPQTPFERVCASPASDPARIAALKRRQQELDPFALSRAIQTKLEHIFSAQPRAGRARETPNSNFSEWQ